MRFLTLSRFFTLALALCAITLVGCDSNDDSDDPGGPTDPGGPGGSTNATVTISGDLSASYSGNAYAYYEGDDFLGLVIFDGALTGFNPVGAEYVILGLNEDAPIAEQSYPIDDSSNDTSFSGGYFNYTDQTAIAFLAATGGSISFSSVNSSEVRGSFTMSGDVFTGFQQSGMANAQGSFTATIIQGEDFPDAP